VTKIDPKQQQQQQQKVKLGSEKKKAVDRKL